MGLSPSDTLVGCGDKGNRSKTTVVGRSLFSFLQGHLLRYMLITPLIYLPIPLRARDPVPLPLTSTHYTPIILSGNHGGYHLSVSTCIILEGQLSLGGDYLDT